MTPPRNLPLVPLALALSACALPPPADVDYDAAPDAATSFRVGGTISGLWDGAAVTLRLVASDLGDAVVAEVDANGAFQLDGALADGASYTVTIEQQPVEHTCTLTGGEGTIDDADATGVEVTCVGPAVAVSMTAPVALGFDPEVTTYAADVSVVVQQTRFTFTAPQGADVRLNDVLHAPDATTAAWSLSLGANVFAIQVSIGEISRTYTITLNRGAEVLQYLFAKPSNPDLGDSFGASIDVDGDTMVVGAPGEDSGNGNPDDDGASGAGAAYVFRRTGDVWVQEAYLKSSAIDADDEFGAAVAISGDLIVVGAPREDSTATGIGGNDDNDAGGDVGAAYAFRRVNGTWQFDAYIKPHSVTSPMFFGAVLALDGTTLAVGTSHAVFDTNGVWVFTRGSSWSQQVHLPGLQANTAFGSALSIDGDTLAIGARAHDSCATGVNGTETDTGCNRAGAAYVYVRAGSNWTKQAYLKASNADAEDRFGHAVSVDGDHLIIGAPLEDSASATDPGDDSATDRGAAYAFTRSGTTWGQVAMLKSSNVSTEFGRRVRLAGEIAAVAAAGGSQGGAVSLFRRNPAWAEAATIPGAERSVAISEDTLAIGDDSEDTLAAGINPKPDSTAPTSNNVGAAYGHR